MSYACREIHKRQCCWAVSLFSVVLQQFNVP